MIPREDTTTRTEPEAAATAAALGRDEHIGNPDGDQEPAPWFARTVGPDPWTPFTCARCGSETKSGMPETCPDCGMRNYG